MKHKLIFQCTECKKEVKNPDWNGCEKCKNNKFQTLLL